MPIGPCSELWSTRINMGNNSSALEFCCEKCTLWLGVSMRKRKFCLALFFICVIPVNALQQRADQEIIRQARQSYYDLKTQGLVELRCVVQPDWDSLYKSVNPDKVGIEQLLPILKGTHFTVLLGPAGASTISHDSDTAPPSENVAERIRQSVDGMEQILTGFFHTWSGFMFNSMLPEPDSKYHLEELGEKYALSFDEKTDQVAMVLNHQLAIEEVKVSTSDFDATLHPQWSPSSNGLVLAGYEANYKGTSSDPMKLSVQIEYREVEGLSLPSIVNAQVPIAAGNVSIRLVFLNYQVKKRDSATK